MFDRRHDDRRLKLEPEPRLLIGAVIVPDHAMQTAHLVGIARPPGKLTRTGPLREINYVTGVATTDDGLWRLQ